MNLSGTEPTISLRYACTLQVLYVDLNNISLKRAFKAEVRLEIYPSPASSRKERKEGVER